MSVFGKNDSRCLSNFSQTHVFWNFDHISRTYNQINYTNIWFEKVIIILIMTAQVLFFQCFFRKRSAPWCRWVRSLYGLFLYLCALFMCSLYTLFLCALCIRSLYVLFLCAPFTCSFYALFVFSLFMRSLFHGNGHVSLETIFKILYKLGLNLVTKKFGNWKVDIKVVISASDDDLIRISVREQ